MWYLIIQNAESKASVTFVQFNGDDLRAPRRQTTQRLEGMWSTNDDVTVDERRIRHEHLLWLGFKQRMWDSRWDRSRWTKVLKDVVRSCTDDTDALW